MILCDGGGEGCYVEGVQRIVCGGGVMVSEGAV